MRKEYTKVFKEFFYEEVTQTRCNIGITQEEMVGRLSMACRTYINLDHCKSGCSVLTLALYLIYICEDPVGFLQKLRTAFEVGDDNAASDTLWGGRLLLNTDECYTVCPVR